MKLGVFAGACGAALAGLLGIAVGLATPNAAQAAVVDITYDLTLNGMSSGTCPAGSCGTITVTGDTTSSLTYDVELAPGVSFHGAPNKLADFFYFDVTGGSGKTITADLLTGGSGYAYNGISHRQLCAETLAISRARITTRRPARPGMAARDPAPFVETCCKFTVNGGSMADPLVIGAPLGHGLFPTDNIAFVADLSISGSCGDFIVHGGHRFSWIGRRDADLDSRAFYLGDDAWSASPGLPMPASARRRRRAPLSVA